MRKLISYRKIKDVNILKFHFNEINFEEREELQKKLNGLLDLGENKFIIDFSETLFISSLAITIMVAFAKKARKAGGNVKLCSMSDDLVRVFHVMNLDKVFERYSSVYFALESFKHDL